QHATPGHGRQAADRGYAQRHAGHDPVDCVVVGEPPAAGRFGVRAGGAAPLPGRARGARTDRVRAVRWWRSRTCRTIITAARGYPVRTLEAERPNVHGPNMHRPSADRTSADRPSADRTSVHGLGADPRRASAAVTRKWCPRAAPGTPPWRPGPRAPLYQRTGSTAAWFNSGAADRFGSGSVQLRQHFRGNFLDRR